jgi:spectrin alpha
MDEWTYLTRKSSEKGEKLKEANRQRMYTAAVKDLEFWLGEVWSWFMCLLVSFS